MSIKSAAVAALALSFSLETDPASAEFYPCGLATNIPPGEGSMPCDLYVNDGKIEEGDHGTSGPFAQAVVDAYTADNKAGRRDKRHTFDLEHMTINRDVGEVCMKIRDVKSPLAAEYGIDNPEDYVGVACMPFGQPEPTS